MTDLLSADKLQRIRDRMEEFDTLPTDYRALVHEYGWGIVHAFWRLKIPAKQARHLIETVLRGSYEIRERRWTTQTVTSASERINSALSEFNLPMNGSAIVDALRRRGAVVLPMRPSRRAVEASLNALPRRQPMQWVTDYRKHEMRLQDAMDALIDEEMSPHV